LKTQQSKLEEQLGNPATYSDKGKFTQTESEHKKVSEEIAQLNAQYETIFEKIVELEAQV
jgi:ATP-binding cassette subfamily F protein 3